MKEKICFIVISGLCLLPIVCDYWLGNNEDITTVFIDDDFAPENIFQEQKESRMCQQLPDKLVYVHWLKDTSGCTK